MSVKKDASGRRSVQAEVEVPGTSEEVWQAIATGPGISSWFVPTEVEEREGGVAISHFGPGASMDSVATITVWDPPRRFVAETDELGAGEQPIATEWVVEARSADTCVARVSHSWFSSSDAWDEQFEGHEQGWLDFFRILRLYLTHFRGKSCAPFQLMGVAPEPKSEAWTALMASLGLAGAAVGQRVKTVTTAPPLAGLVERVGAPEYPEELLLRLDEPGPGLAHFFAMPMGGQIYLPIRIYLYGAEATDDAARNEPLWQSWINERFLAVGDVSSAASSAAEPQM